MQIGMANVSKRYNKKWSELTPAERAKSGSKAEHSAKRKAAGLKGTSASATARANAQAHQAQTSASAAKTDKQKQQEYNNYVPDWGEQYRKDNEPNPGETWGDTHTVNFGNDGKLNMDGSKQQLLNTEKLFELGYSEGDNLYRGGDDGKGRFGTGLMGQGGLEINQAHINAHWQGGSNFDPQVARMIESGQIKLDDTTGTWSSYDKQGNQIQSGNIDTSRKRYGYTHESANAARDDRFYNSESNAGVKSQAQQFTQQQKVRDAEARKAEIKRSQDPYGRPNFDGAWSNPKANEIYRKTGGSKEFNPSAYADQGRQKNSKLQDQINKSYASMNFKFDPTRFIQGQ